VSFPIEIIKAPILISPFIIAMGHPHADREALIEATKKSTVLWLYHAAFLRV